MSVITNTPDTPTDTGHKIWWKNKDKTKTKQNKNQENEKSFFFPHAME